MHSTQVSSPSSSFIEIASITLGFYMDLEKRPAKEPRFLQTSCTCRTSNQRKRNVEPWTARLAEKETLLKWKILISNSCFLIQAVNSTDSLDKTAKPKLCLNYQCCLRYLASPHSLTTLKLSLKYTTSAVSAVSFRDVWITMKTVFHTANQKDDVFRREQINCHTKYFPVHQHFSSFPYQLFSAKHKGNCSIYMQYTYNNLQ